MATEFFLGGLLTIVCMSCAGHDSITHGYRVRRRGLIKQRVFYIGHFIQPKYFIQSNCQQLLTFCLKCAGLGFALHMAIKVDVQEEGPATHSAGDGSIGP